MLSLDVRIRQNVIESINNSLPLLFQLLGFIYRKMPSFNQMERKKTQLNSYNIVFIT